MTISKDTFYGIIIVVLAGLLVLSVFTQGFGIMKSPAAPAAPSQPTQPSAPSAPTQPTQPAQPTQPSAPTSLQVATGDYSPLGNASAPVSWVEFSDFQCPFCGRLYSDAEAQVRTNYINTGKVKLYYRDYPLPFHPNADPAANAARCANEQGKFWQMHDQLFGNQNDWVNLGNASSKFEDYAVSLGLNNATFSSCLGSKKYESAIQADEQTGAGYGVQGTPSNFLVIPKAKISQTDLQSAISSLNSQYGQGITLYVNSDTYVVLIPGAYPFAAFDTVLSKVSY